ncbi:guanitoxin biosynthesis L-enduracididine beta-hydroxylase GntD [Dactylosporangium siamense]|uniref:L-asparagine oxygenase n=1 Tax=Dactylosporangium siamense TaxID=685454 RepID=A0A919UIC2_9ACTN|nr:guanitoxin biosynthesis L-enduracididine beta-hydroxylase GntD [Dactylosporangium siamense]GIG52465.1 L-asparagine oxygenase [Dactylosporangium siamense]
MDRLQLEHSEVDQVNRLLDRHADELWPLDTEEALHRAAVLAHQLPERTQDRVAAFRLEQTSGVLCISGYKVDQDRLGPTPSHWRDRPDRSPAHREELALVMLGSLLGHPFAWATQQDGRLIHDVVPIKGHEHEQLGSSSEALLTWHTEDAFHPLRGDYLTFACLRNPYAAATTVGYADHLDLPDGAREVLMQERFGIRPDESHLAKNNSEPGMDAFDDINEMQRNPDLVAVLFGDPAQPYIRADPYFMIVPDGDQEAQWALDALVKAMDNAMFDMVLDGGDFCFIDNYRVVHGRKPFTPRHDGTDRWLKRINLTLDLRKSRSARPVAAVRAIH